MTRGVPMIDPKVHLKGATPEKLARALFRKNLRSGPGIKPVVSNEVAVEKIATDKSSDGVTHLVKRV